MAYQMDEEFPPYTGTALSRDLSQTDFDDAEEYFQSYHADFVPVANTWSEQANELSIAVNGYSVDALASENAASVYALQAASSANNKGAWSNLAGALNIPASVNHTNSSWILNVDLVDVTASEPTAVNTDWTEISGVTQAELDEKAALAGATFTGQVKGIAPVAAVDLTRKDYVDTAIEDYVDTAIEGVLTGFKNQIINGAFNVNQYADIDTAPVIMVNGDYQIDRQRTYSSGATGTIQRLPRKAINGYYNWALELVATSTASGFLATRQPMENFMLGETKTASVWVKSNSVDARVVLYDGVTFTASSPHSGSGNYELLRVTKAISSSATQLTMYVGLVSDALSNVSITSGDYIESTMWQLEDGDTATNFEQRLIGFELSLCQRFLPYSSNINHSLLLHGIGNAVSTTRALIKIDTKSDARITPTSVVSAGNFELLGGGTTFAITALAIAGSSQSDEKNVYILADVASGLVAGTTYNLRNATDATAYIQIPTEL